MKIDFHSHSKLAKKMPFSQAYTEGILHEAKQSGLNAVCLTEHYNGIELTQSFEYIIKTMQPDGDCFVHENGLKVFPGLEINAAEGGHFLAIGSVETIWVIYRELSCYIQKKEHPSFEKILNLTKSLSVLLGVSHPFRRTGSGGNSMPDLSEEQLKQLDFIDLNGKDTAVDRTAAETQVQALSKRLGLPVLAGSDTHQSFQFGCIYSQFEEAFTTIAGLRGAIGHGAYSIVYGESASLQVKAAGIIKRLLKEIHTLGGDYVSILFDLQVIGSNPPHSGG
jgi:hypothetical protein